MGGKGQKYRKFPLLDRLLKVTESILHYLLQVKFKIFPWIPIFRNRLKICGLDQASFESKLSTAKNVRNQVHRSSKSRNVWHK